MCTVRRNETDLDVKCLNQGVVLGGGINTTSPHPPSTNSAHSSLTWLISTHGHPFQAKTEPIRPVVSLSAWSRRFEGMDRLQCSSGVGASCLKVGAVGGEGGSLRWHRDYLQGPEGD